MTFKRFIAVALSLLLLLCALSETLGSARAEIQEAWQLWETKQPTCTEQGYEVWYNLLTGEYQNRNFKPALGHNWSAWDIVQPATCTQKGLRTRYCQRCYIDEEQETPAAHDWGAWETDIPGTCIEKERLVRKCKRCGALDYWTKDYGDHDWGEWETVKAPTATEPGEEKRVCKNSPDHVETREIPATGEEPVKPEDEKPALSIKLWAIKYNADWSTTEKTEFEDGELYSFCGSVTNTGNVDIELYDCHASLSYMGEWSYDMSSRYLLKPGKTVEGWGGVRYFLGRTDYLDTKNVTPGTETETLAGTITFTATVPGYRPGTDEVICSAAASTSIGVLKDDGPHPSLKFEMTCDENAGEGKRYEGAIIPVYCKTTNTGDCPVYAIPGRYTESMNVTDAVFPNGTGYQENIGRTAAMVNPGESWTFTWLRSAQESEVEDGFVTCLRCDYAYFEDPKSSDVKQVWSDNAELSIPLTYPDGEEPEEAKPELTIKWHKDIIYHNDSKYDTTEPGVLAPEDSAYAWYTFYNTGNVHLKVVSYNSRGDSGKVIEYNRGTFAPGSYESAGYGAYPIKEFMSPGTETEELLGTTTISVYAVGYDPETGEELCKSDVITRTWKVGKDSPWEIPEDSKLTGTLAVAPGYESSDPAGYQLGEEIETVLTVKNTGLIDLETYGVSDPFDSASFSDGPIAVSEEKTYLRAHVTVTEEDVERGYIEFPMITVSWTDPDSEKERTAFAGPLTVPVLKKTGLLLKKGVAFAPEDGDYFKEGEPIQWSLTVTNNSKDAVTDVTVEDKGKTVGSYAEIAPNDTKNCTVPVHIVTEYDAKVVGYVLNSATATGTDYRGAVHTWPSNVAKALTKKPAVPGEDPKSDPEGLHPAITITKAEDPHGPLNGSYYEANEPIKYIITIKNVGDTELKDIAVTDSLAGFAPIGTLPSLAPNEEKTFDYAYTVKEEDIPYCWIYNSATVTYTFGDGIKGTPKTSNTVQSRVGDEPFPPELPHLDPGKLPEGDDWCRLTLDRLGDTKADYTLHACSEHLEAALAAEEAALRSDWTEAAALWRAEVEELYETLYEAADSELKTVLVDERAVYFDYVDSLTALSAEAAANELRMKCAFLCCALHTTPDDLASSLAGDYAQMMDSEEATASARIFAPLTGSDSSVTEIYAGSIAYAQKNVLGLMNIEKSYNWDEVFTRGAQLWTSALDSEVNPVYKGADKETRKLIALWRISLDSLSTAERPFLELLYEGNDIAIEETLMNLYKDAALITACIK